MKRTLTRLVLALILSVLAIYIGDNLQVRYRIHTGRKPFGEIEVKRYFAIRHKDQRIEFAPADTDTRPCVHSLFPQFGTKPCWYVSRNSREQIDM